jgi:SAM-dependent methyltransferase
MTVSFNSPMVDQKVVDRYRQNYALNDEIGIDHVKRHWELETALTEKLLKSGKADRWKVFSECYTKLYSELPWLNKVENQADDYSLWGSLINPRSRIFEIGSGKAQLLKYLASLGHDCVATEITIERGAKHAPKEPGLEWRETDGVNLARFEASGSYDVVISSNVIEHLHPDDILEHFYNVAKILKPGGRYIVDTPHVGTGPHDLSRVFDFDRPVCMHLREYTFLEMRDLLRRAGFSATGAVLYRRRPLPVGPYTSAGFLKYCCAWDWFIERSGISFKLQRRLRNGLLQRVCCLPTYIWLCATK